jgi:hypothetical protein
MNSTYPPLKSSSTPIIVLSESSSQVATRPGIGSNKIAGHLDGSREKTAQGWETFGQQVSHAV